MQVIRRFFLILCLVTTGIFNGQHLEPIDQSSKSTLARAPMAPFPLSPHGGTPAQNVFSGLLEVIDR
jgi:hypothetical protein